MGNQSKIKKPEKLGRGQVTPIQVAFIVDRYLIDNSFIQSLSVFRSEASAFLSKSKTKEAPKSLLSLEGILNEYIRLKEEKVLVDQEKCRVEKLLHGMQEVMNAYRSSYDAPVSPHPEPTSSTPEAAFTCTSWTSTPVRMTSSSRVQCAVTTVPSSCKRKASASGREPTSSTKKSFVETPSCPSNITCKSTGPRASAKKFSHCNGLQHSAVCSPVQPNSENHMLHSPSVKECPSQNNICNQSSSLKRESPSPKTPSQQYSLETDLADSSMAMSSLIESTNPSLEVTPNAPRHSSHGSDYRLNYSEYNTNQVGEESFPSPSKFGTKKYIIKEHIKSRLDFDDFGMAESPVTCASAGSLSETNGEARANPDMDDFLSLSILDTDVSLSYLVSFIGAQVADPTEQTIFDGASNLISSVHDGSTKIDGAFSNPPLSRVGILSQKDTNCNGDDDGQPSKPDSACIKTDNPGRMKTGYSSDQENVPIL